MQLRTLIVAGAIALFLGVATGPAGAQQIYRWKDANGVIHFSQTPPAAGTHYTKVRLSKQPAVASNPAAPPAAADHAPARTGAPSSNPTPSQGDTQPNTPDNRAKLCKQLGSNIALLESKQPVVTDNGNGKQQVMSDSARKSQLATARAQQAQYCASH